MSIFDNSIADSEQYPARHDNIYNDTVAFLQEPMQQCNDMGGACEWDNYNPEASQEDQYQRFTTNGDGTRAELYDYLRLTSGTGDDMVVVWEGFVSFQAENLDPTDPYGWRLLKLSEARA